MANSGELVNDETLWALYLRCEQNAAEVARQLNLPESTIRGRILRIRLAGTSHRPTVLEPANEHKNRIQDLLDHSSVQTEAVGKIRDVRLSAWGGGIKNKEGEWEEHGLYATKINLYPDTPRFPLVQPATPTTINHIDAPRILKKVKQIVIVSDAQIGYLRDVQTQKLEPIHDPRALEICRRIIADVNPVKCVGIGDWMDWSTFGRWQKRPEFFGVVQPSIQAGYEWKGRLVAAANAKCEWWEIGSNHAIRPETFILEYNREALHLTRAVRPEDRGALEWPVFSEQFLLRYDELGIKFSGHYPGGELYLLPDLVALHAPPKKTEFAASYIHGHTHRLQAYTHVIHSFEGRKTYVSYDTGCLCSVDTTTNTRRLLVTRVPSDRGRTDWAQGLSVIEYIDDKLAKHQVHLVRIDNGISLFAGKIYQVSESDVTEPWLKTYGAGNDVQ